MADVAQRLARAAVELEAHAAGGATVGLGPDDVLLLARRLSQWSRMPVADAMDALSTMAALFGEDRSAWHALSPACVERMDALRDR